ncbi:TPA: CpXC domain-containing protein [Streptococcus suis]|nr:CpXC domain-containing protein [Streptococcus suis]HEL2046540.1 CpXC domain-containing protein [Streptococcus suis]
MTSIFISTLTCPTCGVTSPFERHDVLDVSVTPELKQSIIDWEFFKFTCNHCGYRAILDYPTLYIDPENKTAIQYLPSGIGFGNSISMSELQSGKFDFSEFRYRVVANLEEFAEKVQIFSDGFDDRAIEVMKYIVSPKEEDDIQFSYENMVFTKIGPTAYQFMFINQNEAVASLNFSFDLYQNALDDVHELEENESIINEKWAEQQVRYGLKNTSPSR